MDPISPYVTLSYVTLAFFGWSFAVFAFGYSIGRMRREQTVELTLISILVKTTLPRPLLLELKTVLLAGNVRIDLNDGRLILPQSE